VDISTRKKLIRTMPPNTDRPINRAMVVGCAVSATRNHLKITRAKNIKNTLSQRSCQNAKVVEALCSHRVHHQDRHQHTIPIALAALSGAILPATSCIGAFRPPALGVREETVTPAAENLHRCGHERLGRVDLLRNNPFEAYPTGGGARAALQTQKCEL
jgi:hypothetical protein